MPELMVFANGFTNFCCTDGSESFEKILGVGVSIYVNKNVALCLTL